jgi:hypothetical protein
MADPDEPTISSCVSPPPEADQRELLRLYARLVGVTQTGVVP